jgi:hypothetical protein
MSGGGIKGVVACICLDEHLAFDTISSYGWHRMSVRSIYVPEYHDVFYFSSLSIFNYIFHNAKR